MDRDRGRLRGDAPHRSSREHRRLAARFRELLAAYEQRRDLILLGAYAPGSDPLTDEAIHRTIREGLPGTDMPPTSLSDEDTWNLVAYVKVMTGPASENDVPGDPAAGAA